jgi:hypothetical protein
VEIRDKDEIRAVVFMTPGGWYERALEREKSEREE